MMTNPIQTRCERATKQNIASREEQEQLWWEFISCDYRSVHPYPLYSKNHWSKSGYCFAHTIKNFICERAIMSGHVSHQLEAEIEEFVSLGIHVFPFVFHGNLGANPRADDSSVHPLFDDWWRRDKLVHRQIRRIVYHVLIYTEYHLFPQPDALFEYLFDKRYTPRSTEDCYKLCVAYGTIPENNELIGEDHIGKWYTKQSNYLKVPAWVALYKPEALDYFFSIVKQTSVYQLIADDILRMIASTYIFFSSIE